MAQIHIQLGNIENNYENALNAIRYASEWESTLLLLPELWSSGYDWDHREHYCNSSLTLINRLSDLADENHVSIGGSFLEYSVHGKTENVFSLIQPGKIIHRYSKIHLFGPMGEKTYLQAGNHPVMVDFPWGRAGLATCYDLRFPELFRYYTFHGCQIIFLVAEWPQKRIDHWNTLLKARAIENQIFIAAVNSVGKTGQETFGGNSTVLSPWGEVLLSCQEEQNSTANVEIDLSDVQLYRQQLPALEDRRPDLYQ